LSFMNSKPLQMIPRRIPVLLALLLVFLAGGIRLGEWTHCLEMDGRVHVETGGDACASDGPDHVDHDRLEAPLTSSPVPTGADCDGCLDITGRSLGLRLRNESIDSASNQVLPLHFFPLPVADPVGFILLCLGDPDFSSSSLLTFRNTDSVILTC